EGRGGDKSGGQGKSDAKSNQGGGERGQGKSGNDRADDRRLGERSTTNEPARQPSDPNRTSQPDPTVSDPQTPPIGLFGKLANVLKWLVLAILAVIVALVVLWFVARHLAGASEWARQLFEALSAFWRSLFGGSAPQDGDVVESVVVQERPRPFADFS